MATEISISQHTQAECVSASFTSIVPTGALFLNLKAKYGVTYVKAKVQYYNRAFYLVFYEDGGRLDRIWLTDDATKLGQLTTEDHWRATIKLGIINPDLIYVDLWHDQAYPAEKMPEQTIHKLRGYRTI